MSNFFWKNIFQKLDDFVRKHKKLKSGEVAEAFRSHCPSPRSVLMIIVWSVMYSRLC